MHFGIFQWRDTSGTNDSGVSWNSPRIQWLNKFAEINNLDPNDIKTQVLYTDWELRSKFRDTYDKLQSDNLKDISGATKLIDSSYVYSAGGTIDERIKNANQVFKNLSGVNTNQNINTDYLDLDSTLVDDPEKLINTNFNPNTNNNTNLNMSNELEGNEMAINNLGLTNGNIKRYFGR